MQPQPTEISWDPDSDIGCLTGTTGMGMCVKVSIRRHPTVSISLVGDTRWSIEDLQSLAEEIVQNLGPQ